MYSPDGKQILYHSASDMYIMNADGTNRRTVRDVPEAEHRRLPQTASQLRYKNAVWKQI